MIERTYEYDGIKFKAFEDDIKAIGSKGEEYSLTFGVNKDGTPAKCTCRGFVHRGNCRHLAAAMPILHLLLPELKGLP